MEVSIKSSTLKSNRMQISLQSLVKKKVLVVWGTKKCKMLFILKYNQDRLRVKIQLKVH